MSRSIAGRLFVGCLRCFAIALGVCVPAVAQVQWSPLTTGSGGPTERNAATMTYVFSRGETFLYSGWWRTSSLTDLWSWNGTAWTLVDAAAPPGMRWGCAMTYDLFRDRLIVFGGARGFYIADTWELDCQAMTWTQRNLANAPSPRAHMSSAFDLVRGVMVIFGGEDFGGPYDETWEWDGVSWTQRTFAVSPSARARHSMAFDYQRQRIVMFGGRNGSGTFNDTWEYDGTAWVQRSPSVSPSPRAAISMAWDAGRARTVVYGGNSNPGQPSGVEFDETWEWDGTNWRQRQTANLPANAMGRCTSFDFGAGRLLLFGAGANREELWALEPVHVAQAISWGAGCAGSAGTPALFSSGPDPWLGESIVVSVRRTPASGAILVAGWSATAPVSLQSLGRPGCSSLVSYDATVFAAPAQGGPVQGGIDWALTVPNRPVLLGTELHQQALVRDAAAPAGFAVSNAVTLRIGGR